MSEPLNIRLSRDELLLILGLLQADRLPGLDPEPLGELTTDQRAIALIAAGRGLRARQLARMRDDGEIDIHTDLLTAVGSCAYAQRSLFVYHWAAETEIPERLFGHVRHQAAVTHHRLEDVLHQFSLMSTAADFWADVAEFCHDQGGVSPAQISFPLHLGDLGELRELVSVGNRQVAVSKLTDDGVSAEQAELFVSVLGQPHEVSVFQTVNQLDLETVERRDITWLRNERLSCVMYISGDSDADDVLLVKSLDTAGELWKLLAEWMPV